MNFLYSKSDEEFDRETSAAGVAEARPDLVPVIEHIQDLRKITDDLGKITSWGTVAGTEGAVKAYCRVPSYVLWKLVHQRPELLDDEKAFGKWLLRHKEWHSYTKTPKRGK